MDSACRGRVRYNEGGVNKYSHSVTLSLRKKRSGTYRFSFADTPKILVPTFFKELRGNICSTVRQVWRAQKSCFIILYLKKLER